MKRQIPNPQNDVFSDISAIGRSIDRSRHHFPDSHQNSLTLNLEESKSILLAGNQSFVSAKGAPLKPAPQPKKGSPREQQQEAEKPPPSISSSLMNSSRAPSSFEVDEDGFKTKWACELPDSLKHLLPTGSKSQHLFGRRN